MRWFERSMRWLWQDKKTKAEQRRERTFIASINALKTLQVTPGGGMSIDPKRYESAELSVVMR
jgi:hypothetical protein